MAAKRIVTPTWIIDWYDVTMTEHIPRPRIRHLTTPYSVGSNVELTRPYSYAHWILNYKTASMLKLVELIIFISCANRYRTRDLTPVHLHKTAAMIQKHGPQTTSREVIIGKKKMHSKKKKQIPDPLDVNKTIQKNTPTTQSYREPTQKSKPARHCGETDTSTAQDGHSGKKNF